MPAATINNLLDALAGAEPRTSTQLQAALGISQSGVSRLVRDAGRDVLRLGAGPATRYTLAADVFGAQAEVSLFEVGESGIVQELGSLRQTRGGRFLVDGPGLPFWARGAHGNGQYGGLPYFLADMRPAGFMGRLAARSAAPILAASDDPREWTTAQVGQYLLRFGADLPGHLVVGSQAAAAANRATFPTVRERGDRYPELVQRNLDGEPPGSSAQGEQPKFLAHVENVGHVIVKYSEPDDTAAGRRWGDLLVAEHGAHAILVAQGLPAADAEVFRFDGRTYLESRRFDRAGRRGRLPAFSLGAVDAEFVGEGSGWTAIAAGLLDASLLDPESYEQIVWLDTFGDWIGNTDRHDGNLSLRPGNEVFALLPAYDMLPMRLARPGEALESIELPPPIRTRRNADVWEATGLVATAYWEELSDASDVSGEFRTFAVRHARRARELLGG